MKDERSATEFAWNVHAALCDWTAKVDVKGSFALTLELAAVSIIVSWSSGTGPLASLDGWPLRRYQVGTGLLTVAILAAVGAVIPQIRWWSVPSEWNDNYIYFGHVKHWNPEELAARWQEDSPLLPLARQHVVMSRIAWRKHLLLQFSLIFALVGGALVASAS